MGLRIAFKQLATCIHDLGRQFGISDEAHAHYAVERLEIAEICTVNITHRRRSRSGWSGFGRTTFIQGKNETSFLQKASNEQKC